MSTLYLASASPRRAQLLEQINQSFVVLAVDIDETPHSGESPLAYVQRVAAQKAEAAWQDSRRTENWPVLAADTTVVLGDAILGKPASREQGMSMWRRLSGQTHQVMTAVCLRHGEQVWSAVQVSDVHFRPMSEAEIADYWSAGEGFDKAGGYAVQGMAARFIDRLTGSYSGVMGLPLHVVDQLLREWKHS